MIKNAKESHLRKAKGEKLQKEIVADLKKHFPDHADNIKSSPMSAHGEDVQLTDEARKAIPFSFEAKYKEKGLSKAIECCKKHNATLTVSNLDRLSRNLHQITGFMDDKKLELRVASLPNATKPMLQFYGIMAEMERDFISKRTKDALASAKARGVKLGGARPNQKARHEAVKKDADDRAKTVEPVIKAMRDSGNTWDQIAKHMNKLSIPTARGRKSHGKTVLNAHQRLT